MSCEFLSTCSGSWVPIGLNIFVFSATKGDIVILLLESWLVTNGLLFFRPRSTLAPNNCYRFPEVHGTGVLFLLATCLAYDDTPSGFFWVIGVGEQFHWRKYRVFWWSNTWRIHNKNSLMRENFADCLVPIFWFWLVQRNRGLVDPLQLIGSRNQRIWLWNHEKFISSRLGVFEMFSSQNCWFLPTLPHSFSVEMMERDPASKEALMEGPHVSQNCWRECPLWWVLLKLTLPEKLENEPEKLENEPEKLENELGRHFSSSCVGRISPTKNPWVMCFTGCHSEAPFWHLRILLYRCALETIQPHDRSQLWSLVAPSHFTNQPRSFRSIDGTQTVRSILVSRLRATESKLW